MNECRELEPLLASYAEGEAGAAERARVDAHTELCGPCRNRVVMERAVCQSIRARRADLRARASDHLKKRCERLAAPARTPGTTAVPLGARIRQWVPLTAAATVLLAVAAVFGLGLNNKVQALALQATLDHATCTRFNMGSSAADPVAAAEQWHGRFGWPIKVPASTSDGPMELRGVRRCGVTDGQVAHFMYVWQGEPLSVYVLPREVLGGTAAYAERFGHEAVMWSQNGRTYMVVANRHRDAALERVVAYVRANAY